jgi:hypothetical protein
MAMPVGCTRSFLRNPTAMVAAGGGLIGLSALGIIVVLIVGGNPITRTATQASTRQPVSAPAGQEVDGALARRVAIDTSSLSPGWRLADEGFSSPEDLAQHRCASTAFATPTSNFYRAFQYNVTAHGYSGDLYVAVSTAATAADSDRSWAVITSDQYLPCLTSWSQEGLTGPDTSPTGKTIVRRVGPAPDVAAPSIVYELQTPYRLHGENKVMHETDVHVAQGRVTAHMIVGRCCSEAEDEGWKTMIRQLSVTLAHNLEGNTGT